ncbi:unnamed protein product [Oncorhynchus mykiss]|uniref:Phosphatidylinositol-specific phospholipase C X domain-containing protein n=1 Tax=Oncorhynchus mykiss TaxID=8022 RepID=A0A060Z0Z1_ONCMY|nr:unnamed protein product [Oncorhynchus mykiss]
MSSVLLLVIILCSLRVHPSLSRCVLSALRRGCRCLEIDCWDGPSAEPIVYHGHTLTSKILFKDVITTVGQHAFEVSPYPVILSLENHCTPTQQDVMAQYLTSILGEKLLATSLDLTNQPGQLPSPNVNSTFTLESFSRRSYPERLTGAIRFKYLYIFFT